MPRVTASRIGATRRADQNSIVVTVEADDLDGGFVASFPSFPGVMGQGETVDDAIGDAMDALSETLHEHVLEKRSQSKSRSAQDSDHFIESYSVPVP